MNRQKAKQLIRETALSELREAVSYLERDLARRYGLLGTWVLLRGIFRAISSRYLKVLSHQLELMLDLEKLDEHSLRRLFESDPCFIFLRHEHPNFKQIEQLQLQNLRDTATRILRELSIAEQLPPDFDHSQLVRTSFSKQELLQATELMAERVEKICKLLKSDPEILRLPFGRRFAVEVLARAIEYGRARAAQRIQQDFGFE